jgi:ABC-type transport system involved in cytochrome c biogenesis permease subunit
MQHGHVQMIGLMFVSGILSSMSVWADKISDIRLSINDIYMALLMCAWMYLFMGMTAKDFRMSLYGAMSVLLAMVLIRTQMFIGPTQYATSMIPHHSMAVFMSKRLLEHPIDNEVSNLAKNIIRTQESELEILKRV